MIKVSCGVHVYEGYDDDDDDDDGGGGDGGGGGSNSNSSSGINVAVVDGAPDDKQNRCVMTHSGRLGLMSSSSSLRWHARLP